MLEISVKYLLNPNQVAQLERITKLYNNISSEKITPERLFENIMILGSAEKITKKLSFCEKNFKANQPHK